MWSWRKSRGLVLETRKRTASSLESVRTPSANSSFPVDGRCPEPHSHTSAPAPGPNTYPVPAATPASHSLTPGREREGVGTDVAAGAGEGGEGAVAGGALPALKADAAVVTAHARALDARPCTPNRRHVRKWGRRQGEADRDSRW